MPILTRTIELIPIGDKEERDRCYKWIRDFMEEQSKMMNQYMSALYIAAVEEVSKDDRKELNNLYNRIATSKKGSAFSKEECNLPKGLGANYGQRVRSDFDTACENGLLHGRVSLPTYKKNFPIILAPIYVNLQKNNIEEKGKSAGFYHNYASYNELYDALKEENKPEIIWNFVQKMQYQIKFGNPYKSAFLRDEILHFLEGEYKAVGSQLSINSRGKIILNLSLDVPQKKVKLDENIVVGIDIGLAVPVMCAINNDYYKRLAVGDFEAFTRMREKLYSQKCKLQRQLKYTSGGHGRKKKLASLNAIRDREHRFVHTMNHKYSSEVINFALKNNAKYINMEDLTGFGKDNKGNAIDDYQFVLRNWSYFELQKMIQDKAQKYGIVVRKVESAYTSQLCSCCGEMGERVSQSVFRCLNPNCISHNKYEKQRKSGVGNYHFNADFNAARNISMSTNYTKKKRKTKAEKVEERKKNAIEKTAG
ncbi:MAG: transposase [Pseudobutyrivibrio ruminis]|uniref:Transposase n=1 Tax=Pseudobutyrivibrio ruminis TaxID=46206 RepID=A0A927YLJ2_9FIRM|nr:transposase [Pseudobutyrivibrio ruminis]